MEKLSERYFDPSVNPREHAIFEIGIKLAALYHIMLGAPVKNDKEVLRKIKEGLEASISCQPFVNRVDVEIKVLKEGMGHEFSKKHEFDYTTIDGKILSAEVEVQYENWVVIGRIDWNTDLYYPLMYIKSVEELEKK